MSQKQENIRKKSETNIYSGIRGEFMNTSCQVFGQHHHWQFHLGLGGPSLADLTIRIIIKKNTEIGLSEIGRL